MKVIAKSLTFSEVELKYKTKFKKSELPVLSSSQDGYEVLLKIWEQFDSINHIESFVVLFLNKNNRVHGWNLISKGGISGTVADPIVIFQAAILSNSTGIILSHNHPSGNLKPSEADIKLTSNLVQGGKILSIAILDHIILSDEGYYSFADEGRL